MKTSPMMTRVVGDRVELCTLKHGRPKVMARLDAKGIEEFVAGILATAANAGKRVSEGDGSKRPVVKPDAYSLGENEQVPFPVLTLHFGEAAVGFAIADPREVGEALLAISAKQGTPN